MTKLRKQSKASLPKLSKVLHFLRESNNIEGVNDDMSLCLACEAWDYVINQEGATPLIIKKAHKILMQLHLQDEAGQFRKQPVWIGGREGLHFSMIRTSIYNWCEDLKINNDWKQMHIRFENIHPFIDGNGRVGRILMNFHRLKLGLPILTIHNWEKERYYKWFTKSEKTK